MSSTFAWLDSSERQRRQMRDLLSQFREKGTRDELGLAGIRDTFADLLFPGTGSLQTRPRYFFFVPWMYQELERKRVPAGEIARRARQFELDLIDTLSPPGEEEIVGTIGVRARRNLQRLPSNIYWSGLRTLRILRVDHSQDEFHRDFDSLLRPRVVRNDDGDVVSGGGRVWTKIPAAPASFPKQASLELRREEATFLLDQIALEKPESFFAWWTRREMPGVEREYAWDAVGERRLTPELQRQLRHARNFSEAVQGASLLYNLLLARKKGGDSEWYVNAFDEWHARLMSRLDDLQTWNLEDFWRCVAEAGGRVGGGTRIFVQAWVDLARSSASAESLRESKDASSLIVNREAMLKGSLARFTNERALELWGGSSGLRQMDFRWSNAVEIARDVLAAVNGTNNDQ